MLTKLSFLSLKLLQRINLLVMLRLSMVHVS